MWVFFLIFNYLFKKKKTEIDLTCSHIWDHFLILETEKKEIILK